MNTNTGAEAPAIAKNISIGTAAGRLGISRKALQERLVRGTFPLTPVQYAAGGRRYFNEADVDALASGGLQAVQAAN